MASMQIGPALEPEEWKARRFGALSVERVGDEVHVVVRDPDDQLVSVSNPAELFAMIALANDALPDEDPRKITRAKIQTLLSIAGDQWHGHRSVEHQQSIALLAQTLSALLPPTR